MSTVTSRLVRSMCSPAPVLGVVALLSLQGCAADGPEPVDLQGGGGVTPLSEQSPFVPTTTPTVPGPVDPAAEWPSIPLVPAPFDDDAFGVAVGNANDGRGLVTALPSVYVRSAIDAQRAVHTEVASAVGVARDDVRVEALACEGAAESSCIRRFMFLLTGIDGRLARTLEPLAGQLPRVARDLGVMIWTPTVNGAATTDVLTFHGRRDDTLVGIMVIR